VPPGGKVNSQVTQDLASSGRPPLSRPTSDIVRLFANLHDRRDVANLLEISERHLRWVLYGLQPDFRYRVFSIAKRSGGNREIASPHILLANVQRRLRYVLALVYMPRDSAHGFIQGRSILTNALNHTDKALVLNLDLENFFPSINFGRVRGMFMSRPYGLPAAAATILAQICCDGQALPQGAPTSPIVSNMICVKMDGDLQKLAKRHRCTYSRYADDITLSTTQKHFPRGIATPHSENWTHNDVTLGEDLSNIIRSNGFSVNLKKVRLQFESHHQEVTGLTVNQTPNVSRKYVRQIRAMLHAWEKFGHDEAQKEFYRKYDRRSRNPDQGAPDFRDVVRGKLAFLKMVRGKNDRVYLNLLTRARTIDHSIAQLSEATVEPVGDDSIRDVVWSELVKEHSSRIYLVEVKEKVTAEMEIDEKLVLVERERISCGTAFSIGPQEIATCAHVIENGEISIYFSDEPTSVQKDDFKLHGRGSRIIDAAKMKSMSFPSAEAISVRPPSEPVEMGEQVVVFGYPRLPGAQPKLCVSEGIVRTVTTDYTGTVEIPFLTNSIPPGMSGGPVLDRRGRLVGIAMENGLEQMEDGKPPVPMPRIVAIKYILEIE
jgi:RNA-directed DNA polymerase